MKNEIIRHRLKIFILIQILISTYWNRKWLRGLYTTLKASLRFHLMRLSNAPVFRISTFRCRDGEEAVMYHLRENRRRTKDIWIILPGGMTHGDKFYVHDCLSSGALGNQDDVVVFHNPGIASKVKRKAPPALTDTTYIEVQYYSFERISIIAYQKQTYTYTGICALSY